MHKGLTILVFLACTIGGIAQGVGIGTTTPAASAQLDVSSTTKGFLPPRMTAAQRMVIEAPIQEPPIAAAGQACRAAAVAAFGISTLLPASATAGVPGRRSTQ